MHPYLTQHSTRRFPGCYRLLNQLAGRGLVPAQPIGCVRLANFDAAESHRRREHGGLFLASDVADDDSNWAHLALEEQTTSASSTIPKMGQIPVCLSCDLGRISRISANANASAERSGKSGRNRSHGRQVVTATNTDHSHITLSGPSNLSTNISLCCVRPLVWQCNGIHTASRGQVDSSSGSYDRSCSSTNAVSLGRDTLIVIPFPVNHTLAGTR